MAYETLLTGLDGGVARITLDRPQVRNALSRTMVMAPILRAVGRKRGLLMLLSGEPVSAREAFEFSPTAVALAKEAAFTIQDMEDGKSLRYLRELLALVGLSDDAKEGIDVFFARRGAEWKGR